MKLTFHGAAGTVTGSRTLIESSGKKILIDAGLFQGPKELRMRNWTTSFKASTLDGVILTHAHIDHSGFLPRLVKEGFKKPIWCSRPSAALCRFMLLDSAKLQEEDAEYANRSGYSHHRPAEPLYTEKDVERTLKLFEVVDDEEWFSLSKTLQFRFFRAGHILGSRFVQLSYPTEAGQGSILFSGDLGNGRSKLIKPPQSPPQSDILVLESTYGDRLLPRDSSLTEFSDIINTTTRRGGVVVIPAFAVGRAQEILQAIAQMQRESLIDKIPVYLDSPMALEATKAHLKYTDEIAFHPEDKWMNHPIDTDMFRALNGYEESITLTQTNQPHIVISASGMVTGGRVMHHLKARLPDPKNAVVFVGYQAVGTKGRLLQSGEKDFRIHHEKVSVNASIHTIQQFSAHADWQDSIDWVKQMPVPPKKFILNHGEEGALEALRLKILETFPGTEVIVPEHLSQISI
ncbi:MAG: MBL fold metallo-hydrolase [Proteobacteria bacterium]|nr:MBL fold metallo-hydrolase [Pseudomonadota bacterium]